MDKSEIIIPILGDAVKDDLISGKFSDRWYVENEWKYISVENHRVIPLACGSYNVREPYHHEILEKDSSIPFVKDIMSIRKIEDLNGFRSLINELKK